MPNRLTQSATRAVRGAVGFGAERLASNDWLMGVVYDLMNETNFSGLSEHEEMLSDTERVMAYHRGIHAAVRPGDVVVDMGTGSGLLAMMASRAGAKKVYAIEHGEIIELAREIAAHNSITNIEFVQTNSREFTTTAPIDVIVHEQMGDELFNENMLLNLLDLRDRVLRTDGLIVPGRFRLFVEPVSYADAHRVRRLWNIALPDDIDLSVAEHSATAARFDTGRMDQVWARPGAVESLVGEAEPVLEVDLMELRRADDIPVDHVIDRTVAADGIIDGLCVWFEAEFDATTTLTTSPLAPPTSWGNRVFRVDRTVAAGERHRWHLHLGSVVDPASWSVEPL